jgi:signal transduction histidine kinase
MTSLAGMITRLGSGLRTTFAGRDPAPSVRMSRPLLVFALLVLVGFGVVAARGLQDSRHLNPSVALLIGVLSVLPIALLWPSPLWAARIMLFGLSIGWTGAGDSVWPWNAVQIIMMLIVLFVVALREPLEVIFWVGTTAIALVWIEMRSPNFVGVVILLLAVMITGEQIGRRRRIQRDLVVEAERTDLAEAREAVLRERTRIARELHDVVAHSMSLVAVRAETAPYRLPDLPEPAREEFLALAGTARATLTELRRLLGVLRTDPAALTPQPTLSDVDDLVASAKAAGLQVQTHILGVPASEATGLTVYRIVQEALSNASQHAPGALVDVAVSASEKDVRVEVTNGAPTGPVVPRTGAGHGLIGMRERVELLGGTLEAGPTPEGGFSVVARIPEAA